MDRSKWFFHPVLVFTLSLMALATSLFLYIYWYLSVSTMLKNVVYRFNLDASQVLAAQTWVVILVLSILVAVILLGLFVIFAYGRKTVQLYRMQHNFINNFTHELKTPVASLRLYAETLQKHALERSEQLRCLGFMLLDTERLSDTISRILDLARIESKSYPGEFSLHDPGELIQEFLARNAHMFRRCRVQACDPAACGRKLRINRALFDILLMNLMTNALKYNAAACARIQIGMQINPRQLLIHFEDNGIGFERSERKKIFKKFYQIGRPEDMSAKGSGIGLFMAQSIARIHGGGLAAFSPGPGQGAVFTLSLPLPKQREQR